MRTAFATSLFVAAVASIDVDELNFMHYLSQHGKMYDTLEEFVERKELWLAKDLIIRAHNSRPSNFTLGHNKFSDWREEEMSKLYGEKENPKSNAYC